MLFAWALAGGLAVASVGEAGPSTATADRTTGATMQAPRGEAAVGHLEFAAGHKGSLAIHDEAGNRVAVVTLGRPLSVALAPGRYTLRDPGGSTIDTVVVDGGARLPVELPERFADEDAAGRDEASKAAPTVVRPSAADAVAVGTLSPPAESGRHQVQLVQRRRWKRWAAPLMSAVVPGAGQVLNRQPGRGLAVFTGTAGMILGTVAVWAARDPNRGASAGNPGGDAREVVRLGGLAGLSSAAGLLYIGQILDAHAQASGGATPTPVTRHRVAVELSRFTTVAFAPGQTRYQLYPDWSLAVMAQVVPRVSVGLSDASVKYTANRQLLTMQAGARAAYRFFERRRLWLSAGGGMLLQGTRADASPGPIGPTSDAPESTTERAFSAVPYVHFDARVFLLDRWSLGLTPRVSLPLRARRFGRGLAMPRYATTFEVGATMGVLF